MATFALVDCNSFYVSCEQLFAPWLRGRAVIVLSNNDGCTVARSREAKALGIQMGTPFFQVKPLVDAGQLVAMSSNYTLYGDISQRVMETLSQFAPAQEVYSIDECFLDLTDVRAPEQQCALARETVLKNIGIPTSVGIGPTKTLAKLASDLAKQRPSGIYGLPAPGPGLASVLAAVPVEDVWGVGPRISAALRGMGVITALDLARLNVHTMRARYGVTGARVIEELRGVSCFPLEEAPPAKQSITCSRSFAGQVTELDELRAAVATFVERAGEKVRAGRLCASAMTTFVERNRFDPSAPRCDGAFTVNFPVPTNLNREFMAAADRSIRLLWDRGGLVEEGRGAHAGAGVGRCPATEFPRCRRPRT
ncbi:MAG: Y-family DNA polymerase [Paludibaculum sp.]